MIVYLRDIFIIQPECFIYPSRLKSVSQHVRASSFPRWATFLLSLWTQLAVWTQDTQLPLCLSFSIYPQPPCACPNTKSLLQPTPFCGRLPDVRPLSLLPHQLLVPDPPTQLCPRQLFYIPLSTFLAETWAAETTEYFLWIWGLSFISRSSIFPWCVLFVFRYFGQVTLKSSHQESITAGVGNVSFQKKKRGKRGFAESSCCSSRSTKWKNIGSWSRGKTMT